MTEPTNAFADTTSDVKAYMLAKGVTVTGTLTQGMDLKGE